MSLPAGRTSFAVLACAGLFLSGLVAIAAPAGAVSAPPAASNLAVPYRYDHTLVLTFSVPAAFYDAGAGAVVRMTAGRTPASSPTTGYAVPTTGHTVTVRPLTASTCYTFAVWIRDHGLYSARRTITSLTLADVTPPATLYSLLAGIKSTASATPGIALTLTYARDDVDIAGIRIVRNTAPTSSGATVLWVAGKPVTYVDTAPHAHGVRYYYWAIPRDTTGHYAAHYAAASLLQNTWRISGTYDTDTTSEGFHGDVVSYDTTGQQVRTDDNYYDGGTSSWHLDVAPGQYTVCQAAPDADPDLHFQTVSTCAVPDGTGGWLDEDWTSDFPAGSVGAVDVRSGNVSGVPVSWHWD